MGWLDRAARAIAFRKLDGLSGGRIALTDALGTRELGEVSAGVSARVTVRSSRFYRRAVTGGSLGVAGSYIDGEWDCDDLTAFFRVFVRSVGETDRLERGMSKLGVWLAKGMHRLRRNTRSGSRKNIRDHYDLGNDLFSLFLDETMSYSCGVFDRPEMSLREASESKLDRACRKLRLSASDHLVEIGTGWGGLAIWAAGKYGCRVTTTTISQEQFELAKERIAAAGLADRVTVLLEDYRDLRGQYDKLVSIEMIEAVGHEYLPTYFGTCASLLRPEGAALIQAITMPDDRYEQYRHSTDFIQRYIFPGSCVPSRQAMGEAIASATDFTLADREEIGLHYATTLRAWRTRFFEQIERVRALGYPERFVRMWDYYLCYCEAGFLEQYIGTCQMLLTRPGWSARREGCA
jgi:cyclopropane-fatty-acyl-phospholipid synthase